MKITKLEMARVIVTALYLMDHKVTGEDAGPWKHVKRLARNKREHLKDFYNQALGILPESTLKEE